MLSAYRRLTTAIVVLPHPAKKTVVDTAGVLKVNRERGRFPIHFFSGNKVAGESRLFRRSLLLCTKGRLLAYALAWSFDP